MIRTEKHLYRHIQGWLRREGYVVDKTWQNKGVDKYRVDAVGVRNSGTQYCDDIEIVAIEAKLWGNYQTLGQAENYKDIAHKVYFATASEDKAERYKDNCAEKNLGLLLVNKKTGRVNEVLSAPVSRPRSEAKMIEFLRKLYIGRCSLCKCYFDLEKGWDDTEWLPRLAEFNKAKYRMDIYICKACSRMVNKQACKVDNRCTRLEEYYDRKIINLKKRYDSLDKYYYKEIRKLKK